MLNTIIQEIITLANGSQQDSATAALVLFVLVAFLFLGLFTIIHFVYLCIFKHHYTAFIASSIQVVGALLYFYGDNITNLLNNYSAQLNCNGTCVANNSTAALFCLGVALIIFQIFPFIGKKFLKILKRTEKMKPPSIKKTPDWFSVIDMITILVKLDTLYSAISVMVESNEFCNTRNVGNITAFLVFCILTGILSQLAYFLYALTTNDYSERVFKVVVSVAFVGLIFCLPLYLLADNRQPFDCAFGCDSFADNITANALSCNSTLNSSVRLGFTVLCFSLIAVLSLSFFICNHKARDEEIYPNSPRADSRKEEIEFSKYTSRSDIII